MNENNRSQVVTGTILIGIGMIFLLQTMGIIHHLSWRIFFRFWPVFLIFIGLNILFKRTRIWWIVPILIILTFIGLIIVYQPSFPYDYHYEYEYERPYRVEDRSGIYRSSMELNQDVKELEIDVNFSAGKIDISKSRDSNELYSANLKYDYYRPDVSYNFNEQTGQGSLKIEQRQKRDWLNITRYHNDWNIYLTNKVPVDLRINAGAGDFNLNLDELQVENLHVNTGAGNLEIDLGQTTKSLVLNSGAAEIDLNIPEGIGVEIEHTGVISSNNFIEEGLIQNNNIYRTKNFEGAADIITIKINASASKIDIDFYRVN